MPEPQRARAFDARRAQVRPDAGARLRSPDGLLATSRRTALGGIDRAAADLRELGERAARRGLRVGFEALAWGRHINDYRDAWEVVRRADHPAVGLVLDSFHILARGTDLRTIRSIPRDRIFLVQLADAPRLDMDYLSWSRHFRNFPGQGDLPLADFMDALRATGYRRPALARDLQRPVPRRLGAQRRGRRPSLADLSARPACRALEAAPRRLPRRCRRARRAWASSSSSSRSTKRRRVDFEALLPGSGFRQAGRHIVQGGDALASGRHQHRRQHRERRASPTPTTSSTARRSAPSALRVDDAAAAIDRAPARCSTSRSAQAVGPGELEIPAVRGLGGSLIYFIDRPRAISAASGTSNSEPCRRRRRRPTPALSGVDHISQSMHYDEMLTWLLFYTSLLEVAKTPAQDVARSRRPGAEPGGRSPTTAALRLVLNGSQIRPHASRRASSPSSSARACSTSRFATDDIFATVRQLARERRRSSCRSPRTTTTTSRPGPISTRS